MTFQLLPWFRSHGSVCFQKIIFVANTHPCSLLALFQTKSEWCRVEVGLYDFCLERVVPVKMLIYYYYKTNSSANTSC